MSGICGWSGLCASPDDQDHRIAHMAAALPAGVSAPAQTATATRYAVAAVSSGGPAWIHDDGHVLVAVCGRPRWEDRNLAALSERHGPAHVLAQEYLRRGPAMLDALHGHFALAIIRQDRDEALLAVDRLGIHGLNYTENPGHLLFASTADALLRHPDAMSASLQNQTIYDYVYFHMVPAPASVYAGQKRMLPGQYLLFRAGRVEITDYWRMEYIEQRGVGYPQLKEEFRSILQRSIVTCAADPDVGAFLSGGTDSSTVAGFLSRSAPHPAKTFSIGFDAPGYDETAYARIAAKHFGTDHHEYYVTPKDVVDAIPMIARAYDQPYGNASAVPTYYCARHAREFRINRLLGGDGGDELFGGNSRYATQYIFSLYDRIPRPLRSKLIEPLLGIHTGKNAGLLRKLRSYVRQSMIPLPDRFESYNLLTHFGPQRVFDPDFLHGLNPDHPLHTLREVYHGAHADNTINRFLALDMKHTLSDNDLLKVTRMCELAGVEAAFPLLDEDLVAFSSRLPAELKVRRTRLRYFFKNALADFLPKEILMKSKHGFGLPFGLWMIDYDPLRQLANDSIGQLRALHLFRPAFLDSLLGNRIHDHASYYGTMIWVLMMLAQWFETHKASDNRELPRTASD